MALTRWIEEADARQIREMATCDWQMEPTVPVWDQVRTMAERMITAVTLVGLLDPSRWRIQ
jgi:hypothetical protein